MIESKYHKEINKLVKRTKNKQMTAEEYEYVTTFLGNKNFLVFGTGHDSRLWKTANEAGETVFLENNKDWILDDTTVHVEYTTNILQADDLLEKHKDGDASGLEMNLPDFVRNTRWDCIFVDSPEGWNDKCPGRMQSIYAARQLASETTDIFVHDCNRYVEDKYANYFFGHLVKELTKLRHYRL